MTARQVFDAASALAAWKPQGACTCAGPDGPCENCEANREAYEEGCREFDGLVNAMQVDAYAEGRADELDDCKPMLAWAYAKLHRMNFAKQEDALMLDRIKILLEHGLHG